MFSKGAKPTPSIVFLSFHSARGLRFPLSAKLNRSDWEMTLIFIRFQQLLLGELAAWRCYCLNTKELLTKSFTLTHWLIISCEVVRMRGSVTVSLCSAPESVTWLPAVWNQKMTSVYEELWYTSWVFCICRHKNLKAYFIPATYTCPVVPLSKTGQQQSSD